MIPIGGHGDLITTGSLCREHGQIGTVKQVRNGLLAMDHGNPDAAGDPDWTSRGVHGHVPAGGHHTLGNLHGSRQTGLRQQHGKLLTAEPADHVEASLFGLQQSGEALQNDVPGLVPVPVVDQFEVVKVDHQDGKDLSVTVESVTLRLRTLQPAAAGQDAGQRIHVRQPFEFAPHLSLRELGAKALAPVAFPVECHPATREVHEQIDQCQ